MSAAKSAAPAPVASVSGNPAATTFSTGTGWLGRQLGLRDEWASPWAGYGSPDTKPRGRGRRPARRMDQQQRAVRRPRHRRRQARRLAGRRVRLPVPATQRRQHQRRGRQRAGLQRHRRTATLQPHRTLRGLVRAGDDQGRPEDPHRPRQSRRATSTTSCAPSPSPTATRTFPSVSGLLYSTVFANGALIGFPARLLQLGKRRDHQLHPDQVLLSQPRGPRRKSTPRRHPDRHGPALVQRLLLQHRRDRHQLDARRGQSPRAVRHRPLAPDRHPHRAGRHGRMAPAASTCSAPSALPMA